MNVAPFANFIASIDPWIFLTVGIVLIVADLMLTQTEALAPIGFAIFIIGLLQFINPNPILILWLIPGLLIISFYLQKKLFKKLGKKNIPAERNGAYYIGKRGILKVIELKEDGVSDFYKYKKDISVETVPLAQSRRKILKIILNDGEILPAGMKEGMPVNGLPVEIIEMINEKAIVREVF